MQGKQMDVESTMLKTQLELQAKQVELQMEQETHGM
jgi:hypothetical protein